MLGPYIDFVASLFPCISPYTQESAKSALEQFYSHGKRFSCFTSDQIKGLSQGDIISSLPFEIIGEDGSLYELNTSACILSNSCDIENDKTLLAAPVLDITRLDIDKENLKNNRYYRLLYFPDQIFTDIVVDLGLMMPFYTPAVQKSLKSGRIIKIHSLNLVGYYLLISKLTVHFMRPEDKDVQSSRGVM